MFNFNPKMPTYDVTEETEIVHLGMKLFHTYVHACASHVICRFPFLWLEILGKVLRIVYVIFS